MKYYRKKNTQLMTEWNTEVNMDGVSISDADLANGSPRIGDMIAIGDGDDRWLVAEKFFNDNYMEV